MHRVAPAQGAVPNTMESGDMLLQRESLADRIAARMAASDSSAALTQAQIDECARIIGPGIHGEEGVQAAEPLHHYLT